MRRGDQKIGHEVAGAARGDELRLPDTGPWREETLRKETPALGDLYKRDMS